MRGGRVCCLAGAGSCATRKSPRRKPWVPGRTFAQPQRGGILLRTPFEPARGGEYVAPPGLPDFRLESCRRGLRYVASTRLGARLGFVAFLLALLLPTLAHAAPATLQPAGVLDTPSTAQVGQGHTFRMVYRDPDNDRPRELTMVVDKPSGPSRLPGSQDTSRDFRNGVPVSWRLNFAEAGTYRIHFEGASATARPGTAEFRYPEDANSPIVIPVINPLTQWVMLGIGVAVALFFLPMLVFFVARGMSRRTDPGATARFALLVGILAAASWYAYLFWSLHGIPAVAVVGVVALGAAFVLATMRR